MNVEEITQALQNDSNFKEELFEQINAEYDIEDVFSWSKIDDYIEDNNTNMSSDFNSESEIDDAVDDAMSDIFKNEAKFILNLPSELMTKEVTDFIYKYYGRIV